MAKKRQHNHESKKLQAELVRAIVKENYEPGRQDRCMLAVYRSKIKARFGISTRTFWRYIHESDMLPDDSKPNGQLNLF